jgi:hypothetical protein
MEQGELNGAREYVKLKKPTGAKRTKEAKRRSELANNLTPSMCGGYFQS